eukprot:4287658-Alexandrium_andersonii.AAC.1
MAGPDAECPTDGGSLFQRRPAESFAPPRAARAVSMAQSRSVRGSLFQRRHAEALTRPRGARA